MTVVSAPPLSVTFVQLPLHPVQLPPLSVATSRWICEEPPARPEPESLPPFAVTDTDALM